MITYGGHNNRRPMPSDFASRAPGMKLQEMRDEWHAGTSTIQGWLRTCGISLRRQPTNFKDMPADFTHWAALESSGDLKKRYRVGNQLVARWRRECGISSPIGFRPTVKAVIPANFADYASIETTEELSIRFGFGRETIRRWRVEAGIKRVGLSAKQVEQNKRRTARYHIGPKVTVLDTRDGSLASRAQSHLQRRFSVWRCTPDGSFDPKGSHFRVNGLVRTAEEMIERAKRHGFDPNEWSRLAA